MSTKTALIFGGSRGIGAACVETLSEAGFQVGYTYVSRPAENAKGAKAYAVEITDANQVQKVFGDFQRDFGGQPTCVVANAGINVPPQPLAQFDPDNFRRLVEVNIVGAFNILQAAAQHVADGGTVIGVTTSMVRGMVPNVGPYVASKAAVESLIRALSRELAPRNVRVNAVAPGPVDTDLFRAGKNDEALQRSAALSPFNRVGEPREVAEVVAFLASDKASWVHGQIVQPNGGML